MPPINDFNIDPENIPIPASRSNSFDADKWLDKYMSSVGRKNKNQRPWVTRDQISEPAILGELSPALLASFDYKTYLASGFPHVRGVQFRIVINDASIQSPYGHKVARGNSYFMASKFKSTGA